MIIFSIIQRHNYLSMKIWATDQIGVPAHHHQANQNRLPQNDKNELRCYKRHRIFILGTLIS